MGLTSSLYSSALTRRVNINGVIHTYSTINRFFFPGIIASIISAIVQGVDYTINGEHNLNRLGDRTAIQQGGWQIVGLLITSGTAILAGLIIGLLFKVINKYNSHEQFNDEVTYTHVPSPFLGTDWFWINLKQSPFYIIILNKLSILTYYIKQRYTYLILTVIHPKIK